MSDEMIKRIDERLEAVGMSAAKASERSGMGKDFIRDLKRRPSIRPGAESLSRLARTLKTTPEYLLYGKTAPSTLPVEGLPVVGVVEAGQFRDITLTDQDEQKETVNVVRDERYSRARQYALRISGDSMNQKKLEDGTYAICADFAETGLALKSGMIVHVERRIAGTHLVETTLKEVEIRGKRCFLVPRSSNPKHKEIEVVEDDEMTETVVRGLVIARYSPVEF